MNFTFIFSTIILCTLNLSKAYILQSELFNILKVTSSVFCAIDHLQCNSFGCLAIKFVMKKSVVFFLNQKRWSKWFINRQLTKNLMAAQESKVSTFYSNAESFHAFKLAFPFFLISLSRLQHSLCSAKNCYFKISVSFKPIHMWHVYMKNRQPWMIRICYFLTAKMFWCHFILVPFFSSTLISYFAEK